MNSKLQYKAFLVVLMTVQLAAQVPTGSSLFRSGASPALRITVELKRGGAIRTVSPQTEFRNGDQIKLHFTSSIDAYVYALNETPLGDTRLIFPSEEAGKSNQVRKSQEYTIPSTQGWFRITGGAGSDRVLMVLSSTPLPELEGKKKPAEISAAANLGAAGDKMRGSEVRSPTLTSSHTTADKSSSATTQPGTSLDSGGGAQPTRTAPAANAGTLSSGVATNPTTPNGKPVENNSAHNTTKTGNDPLSKVNGEVSKVKGGINSIVNITNLPRDLSRIPGLGGRDLILEDDVNETYVATSPDGPSAPAVFTVTLVHR